MFSQLREDSQKKHMPEILCYLRKKLDQYIPDPIYSKDYSIEEKNLEDDIDWQEKFLDESILDTVRETIVQSRIGQDRFRKDLISFWRGCAVTNCKVFDILKASHIKPWRDSNNKERLDVYNGLLLVPNLDSIFDIGLISFADDGAIIISNQLPHSEMTRLNINPSFKISRIDKRHHPYLEFHRNNILRK